MPPTPPPAPDAEKPAPATPKEPSPRTASPRRRWGAIQRRFRHEPLYDDAPVYDPQTPWFIETALPEPRYHEPEGKPPRLPRALRHAQEAERFERFRAQPFSSWMHDPGFFWQLVLFIALSLGLLLLLYAFLAHPPTRYH